MGWETFGKAADVIGVIVSGIGTGMTTKDIIESIIDPSAGLNDAIEELRGEIDALGRKIDGSIENQNLINLSDQLKLSVNAGNAMANFPEETLLARTEIVTNAEDGLSYVLGSAARILDRDPTPEEVLQVGTSVAYATVVQLQAAALFSEGSYLGANANEHGGDRAHGGHRTASVQSNLMDAVEMLKGLQAVADQALDVDVAQSTTTYYASDTSMSWSDWWTRETDKAMIEFHEFMDGLGYGLFGSYSKSLTSKEITTYKISADANADTATLVSVFDDFFGTNYQLVKNFSDGTQTLTAYVPTGTYTRIPGEVTGGSAQGMNSTTGTATKIANYLEKGATAAIYAGSPLDGTGASISQMISPVIDLIDGQFITVDDGTGVFHGTRSASDQRGAEVNPYLSAEGDDFISNTANIDGATLYGYGGSDYLKGGDLSDILKGGSGNDVYFGGAGGDLLIDDGGGLDKAVFTGKSTDYSVSVEITESGIGVVVSGKTPVEGSSGLGQDGTDILYGIESLKFDDKVIDLRSADLEIPTSPHGSVVLRGSEDTTELYGWINDTVIIGGTGSEVIIGQAGRDILYGENGDDSLKGNGGNDFLSGGNGNDVLQGGLGQDVLAGGAGADTFVFTDMAQVDRITDFRPGEDKILLDRDVFKGIDEDDVFGANGSDADAMFADLGMSWMSIFFNGADYGPRLSYRDDTLYYDANGDGFGGEVAFATFDGDRVLTSDDFEFV